MSDSTTAVLLDIDGTLVDSTYHHALAWHRAFARHETAPPLWRIHRTIGMGGDKLVAHVAGEEVEKRSGDTLREAWKQEYAALRDEVRPLPGAAELVRGLRERGHRVALASSGDPQFSREAVELVGIGADIEVLTSSEDVEASKPEPDLIGETLARLGGVERAVFVGDTPYDVEAAARAGLPCLGVLTGGFGREELLAAGAVVVAEGPGDLLDLDWHAHLGRPR
ncbi:HAD-IA family hydrolase [Nocardioides sp. dk4132]|uniref:HAD family hydrolase n=1 Tax=unclassified Nocardioides TaxID=2615069 RepID=UPI001296EC66|nr:MULTISPECIES: HAD family hydrolase [unclassified Nocardioides]MQW75326.1 HAD-IA family hydrolase [Nocardioides sp. dk4132]QGA07525.1 HAD-IA family hydrolase [Nocardioides sp. dk884]